MQLSSGLRQFLVLACLLASSGASNAETSQLLNRFGKWTLQKLGDCVILAPTDDRIVVGCSDSMMVYQITLPITDRSAVVWNGAFKAHYFHFTAWADAGRPVDFRLYTFDKDDKFASALASLNPEISTQDTALWALIKSARVKFAYSTVNRLANLTPYRRPILTPLSGGF
jgi:hypothetical protein